MRRIICCLLIVVAVWANAVEPNPLRVTDIEMYLSDSCLVTVDLDAPGGEFEVDAFLALHLHDQYEVHDAYIDSCSLFINQNPGHADARFLCTGVPQGRHALKVFLRPTGLSQVKVKPADLKVTTVQ
jgi:hypothetical protein